ncbi:MAG TPA: radical SAM protein, partial [Xanthobacteraceae bacterium]|nr:radical SAM protein [Xanthobacteraceae bacterium]
MRQSSALRGLPTPPSDSRSRAEESIGTRVGAERRQGRGAQSNASGRYEAEARVAFDDGWQTLEELPAFETSVGIDAAR